MTFDALFIHYSKQNIQGLRVSNFPTTNGTHPMVTTQNRLHACCMPRKAEKTENYAVCLTRINAGVFTYHTPMYHTFNRRKNLLKKKKYYEAHKTQS